jgi:SAM-dependent methyltransferase
MEPGFGGEVADLYHRYRHGYPAAVIDVLAGAFGLTGQDLVVDVGCGTGRLTLPTARRVRAVVEMDPEPDMLRRAADYQPVWVASLADDVTLEGSAMNGIVQGAETVRSIVTCICTLYDDQEFNFAGPYYTDTSATVAPLTDNLSK